MDSHQFLADLALVLCVAAVTTVVFRRLRQPVVLGYLLAGVLVGPYTPIPLFAGPETLKTLSELGVILVMFSIGLEFSLKRLAQVFPRAGLVGLVEIGLMMWLGYLTAQALGWGRQESVFAGAIVSISSTMVIAKVFAENQVGRKHSELVLGVLVIEDLVAILLLAVLTAVASGEGQTAGMLASTAGRLAAFLLALTVGGYVLVPRAIRSVARLRSPDTLLVASVGLCFAFALMAEMAGYSVALGAFLAGSLVAESGRHRQVEQLVGPLRDLFSAIFFVSVGTLVDPTAVAQNWSTVAVFVLVVVVGKATGVTLGAFLSGYRPSTALQAGMSMTQIGEFSFIIAGLGVTSGVIDPALYGIAVAVSVVTSFLTPWLVRISERVSLGFEHRLPQRLRTFASLYGSWLEDLRTRPRRDPLRFQLLRHAGWLALDTLCFAGVVIGTSVFQPRLVAFLRDSVGTRPELGQVLVLSAAGVVILPFAIGILRLSRALGYELASAVLPQQAEKRADLAAAPRRALVVALQLSIVIVVGGPLLALVQPFVPAVYPASLVTIGFLVVAYVFWRRASDLEAHVQAGAQVVVEVLARQGEEDGPSLEDVQPLFPGLGEVTPVRLAAGGPSVGKTLAELDLRARTGASVIAITRDEGGLVAPTGREALREGDTLALAGSREAIQAARRLLQSGHPTSAA